MEINYIILTKTIKILSEFDKESLVNKLLEVITQNEMRKSAKHNRKDDIVVSYFEIDLSDGEVDEIIDFLQENQMKYVGEGENNEQLFYHYSELIDYWIV